MKSTIIGRDDKVTITLSIDYDRTGSWQNILEVNDVGLGAPVITKGGNGGIRGDFLDLEIEGYKITPL
ncbi:hypothetical protein KW783_02015 [Candidatus Parcubacteria bacterium]|nr:hypothetical protein [Candidatus Parcubacteria bacterium]